MCRWRPIQTNPTTPAPAAFLGLFHALLRADPPRREQVLHEVRLSLGREGVVPRQRPRAVLQLLPVHAEHVVPLWCVSCFVNRRRRSRRRRRGFRRGRRRRRRKRTPFPRLAEVFLNPTQPFHGGVVFVSCCLCRSRDGQRFSGLLFRSPLFRTTSRTFRFPVFFVFFGTLTRFLAAPPRVKPAREARVFRRVPQAPDHRRFLDIRQRLSLPAQQRTQHLRAGPADNQTHQPSLFIVREVLLEKRPQLRFFPRDVRLETHPHRRARGLELALHVAHEFVAFHGPLVVANTQGGLRNILHTGDPRRDAQVAQTRVQINKQLRFVFVVQGVRVRNVVKLVLVLERGKNQLVFDCMVEKVSVLYGQTVVV